MYVCILGHRNLMSQLITIDFIYIYLVLTSSIALELCVYKTTRLGSTEEHGGT